METTTRWYHLVAWFFGAAFHKGVPIAMFPCYAWLSSRIIARTPQQCWPQDTIQAEPRPSSCW